MKFILLFCLLAGFAKAQNHYLSFPQDLQDFRFEYLNQKGYYLKYIDRSFFDVYNRLKSYLDYINYYFGRYNSTWSDAYENFDTSDLKKTTFNHLKNIYTDVDYVLTYSKKNVNVLMNSFFVGLLGFESDPQIVAKILWGLVEDHMNSISKLYARNKDCVKESMKKYHTIYIRGAGLIFNASENTKKNISAIYNNINVMAERSGNILYSMANDLTKCSKASNVTACVKTFIKSYENVNEKLFEPVRKSADKIDDIKTIYEQELAKANDKLSTIDDDLSDWTQAVNDCIDNGGPETTESPYVQRAKGSNKTTTTTTKTTTTTTTMRPTTTTTTSKKVQYRKY